MCHKILQTQEDRHFRSHGDQAFVLF